MTSRWHRTARRVALIALGAVVVSVGLSAAWFARRGSSGDEAARLIEVLHLEPGMTAADVGAGQGALSVQLARWLGSQGRLYATDVDEHRLTDLKRAAARAELDNIIVVGGGEAETRLPPACCHAIVLRAVYHHLEAPASMNASLLRSLRPGGLLAVIDFGRDPLLSLWPSAKPTIRNGHGVSMNAVVEELTAAGFEQVGTIANWAGKLYCVIVRRPAVRSP